MRISISVLLAMFAFAQASAVAQSKVVDVGGIEFEVQPTPNFDAGGVKSKKVPNPRGWLEIEVEFEAKQTNKEGLYPEMKFRYHVAIQGEDGTYLISGDVDHVNVVAERELYSVMYVSPTALGTITGDFERFQEGSVKAVAVEVYVGGVLAGGASEGISGKWWESASLKKGSAKLLNKADTPFALLWMDRYADVKAGS